jgi:hypothetical protein
MLLRMLQNETMLSVKEGRHLVAFFLSLKEDMVKVSMSTKLKKSVISPLKLFLGWAVTLICTLHMVSAPYHLWMFTVFLPVEISFVFLLHLSLSAYSIYSITAESCHYFFFSITLLKD